jgi:arylsulfatase A-like enzyme
LDYDVEAGVKIPQLTLIDGQTPDGLAARKKLLAEFDRLGDRLDKSKSLDRLDQFYQQAFSLLTSTESRSVFDLDREPDKLRRKYGRFRFGQCCLLARRLVEADVRFVQVNWSSHVEPVEDTGDGGWDMHDRNFQQLQDRHSWMLDQAMSALLDDLDERGMLDDTVVVAMGEFGRTPKINGKLGRDHWNQCYSGLVAGGGFRTAQVIGSSDRYGEHPTSQPVTPADLFRTVLQQIGIGTTQLTSVGMLPSGELIEPLM